MKLLEFKQFNNSEEPKSLNKKKVITVAAISVVILIGIIIGIVYKNNQTVRDFMDQYLFFKHVKDSDLPYICTRILLNVNEFINEDFLASFLRFNKYTK